MDIDKLEKCDIICHGSPCQDFSIVGHQAGGEKGSGTRSSLLWESVKIIQHCSPKFIIWENVKNVLSGKHRKTFDKYIEELTEAGYNSYAMVLNAKDFELPQNRERVFCVSIRKDIDRGFIPPRGNGCFLCLGDLLEKEVDKKFYISDEVARTYDRRHGGVNAQKQKKWENCS